MPEHLGSGNSSTPHAGLGGATHKIKVNHTLSKVRRARNNLTRRKDHSDKEQSLAITQEPEQ